MTKYFVTYRWPKVAKVSSHVSLLLALLPSTNKCRQCKRACTLKIPVARITNDKNDTCVWQPLFRTYSSLWKFQPPLCIKVCLHWWHLSAIMPVTCDFTCLCHLGWRDTDRIISISVVSPKVAKASTIVTVACHWYWCFRLKMSPIETRLNTL